MAVTKTYYEILGVAKDATADDINKAYRKLSLQYHPDRNPGDEEALEQFKKINEANGILGDEAKRSHYDETQKDVNKAHDVDYFRNKRPYAFLALREFQEKGYIEFATSEIMRPELRGEREQRLYVNLHCKSLKDIPARDLQEFRNALAALDTTTAIIKTLSPEDPATRPSSDKELKELREKDSTDGSNPNDKVIVSFALEGDPMTDILGHRDQHQKVYELVAFVDQHWNDLFFKRPVAASDRLLGGASTAPETVPAAVTPCKYYLTKRCAMAEFVTTLGHRLQADEGIRRDIIAPAIKALPWRLVKVKKKEYPMVDFSVLPPLEGFEGLSPIALLDYHKSVLASLAGLGDFKSKIFSPINPETGKLVKDSSCYVVTDAKKLRILRNAGVIPAALTGKVDFKTPEEPGLERIRKGDYSDKTLHEVVRGWERNDIQKWYTLIDHLKEKVDWSLVKAADSNAQYAMVDFSNPLPLPGIGEVPPEILKHFYKILFAKAVIIPAFSDDVFLPIDPHTGKAKPDSDHYAVIDPKSFEYLNDTHYISADIAEQVHFEESKAGRIKRQRDDESSWGRGRGSGGRNRGSRSHEED